MKSFSFIFVIVFSISGWSVTRATFFGVGAMIQLIPQNPGGAADSDSLDLYKAMNVPVQETMLGPGKAIQSPDQALNLSCAIRNNISHECSIVLNRSKYLRLDPINKKIKFHITGTMADEIRRKFFLTNEEFHFKSTDSLFLMEAVGNSFTLLYSAEGL